LEILAAVRQSGVTARSHVVRVQRCGGPAVGVRSQVVVVAAGRRTVVERSQVVVRPLHDVVDVGLVVVGGRRQAEQCRAALRRRHHSAQRPCLAGTVSYECTDTSNQTSTRPKYAPGGSFGWRAKPLRRSSEISHGCTLRHIDSCLLFLQTRFK